MTLNIFVGRDLFDQTRLPETRHESRSVREICAYLWQIWHHNSKQHYAIVANPKRTATGRELTPDMVVVSQLGLGIIEMKNNPGLIDCHNRFGAWQAGNKSIPMNEKKYKNPHQQVFDYAQQIRDDLMTQLYLPGESHQWADFKFQIAVCFTHQDAKIDKCREFVQRHYQSEVWEDFDILTPGHVREWASDLRFSANLGPAMGNEPFSWTPGQVNNVAKSFFGAREWQEITNLMPKEEPYAYLGLEEGGRIVYVYTLFGPFGESITIGRGSDLQVCIPGNYNSTSRRHACITRTLDGLLLEDLSSTNGTYVGDKKILTGYVLQEGNRIRLGGKKGNRKVCILRYSRKPIALTPDSTTL